MNNEELVLYIKNVILKYCPYVEDRLFILGNANAPRLDIDIDFINDSTGIMFMFGNSSLNRSVPESATIYNIVDFEDIGNIIDFILEDHEVIKNINLYNNHIDLEFAINWTDENIRGINCSDIGLNFSFDNLELKNKYLYLLIQRYYSNIENVPSFQEAKNRYINKIKQSYFDVLDKTELIRLLNGMNESELKQLLGNLDNDVFIKYFMDVGQSSRSIILALKDCNKNDYAENKGKIKVKTR